MIGVLLQAFIPGRAIAADGMCNISMYEQLNFRYRILVLIDESNGGVDITAQGIPPTYTKHKCMCTDPGSQGGDCFYDSDQASFPNPSPAQDRGCEWQDGIASPERCQCSQTVSDCCGSPVDP
jgi:hypothetical protein